MDMNKKSMEKIHLQNQCSSGIIIVQSGNRKNWDSGVSGYMKHQDKLISQDIYIGIYRVHCLPFMRTPMQKLIRVNYLAYRITMNKIILNNLEMPLLRL